MSAKVRITNTGPGNVIIRVKTLSATRYPSIYLRPREEAELFADAAHEIRVIEDDLSNGSPRGTR